MRKHLVLATAWFGALALVVLGPLLAPGYLLLLDAPAGPVPQVATFFPLPSQGLFSAGVPTSTLVTAVLNGLTAVMPEAANKLLIVFVIVVGGLGVYRFCTRDLGLTRVAALSGGTLFSVNPFVYDRLLAGHLLFLSGYALLPWGLGALDRLARKGTVANAMTALAWCAVVGLVSIHVGGMLLLLSVLCVLFCHAPGSTKVSPVLVLVAGMALMNAYWILPAWQGGEAVALAREEIAAFAPRPRSTALLFHLPLLHGFWRAEFSTPLGSAAPTFLLSFLPLVLAAAIGVLRSLHGAPRRQSEVALMVGGGLGVLLAGGTVVPGVAVLNRFLFEQVPVWGLYREPQKWLALLALAYAVFAARGLDSITTRLRHLPYGVEHIVAAGVVFPLLATHTMLLGFGGRVSTSEFPHDWLAAAESIEREAGAVLFLPWHEFQALPFADNRTIASPARHVFRSPVTVSGADELPRNNTRPLSDPRHRYVTSLLRRSRDLTYFGHLVAPLGVRYVALAKLADWRRYAFLRRQEDLEPIFEGSSLTLLENEAWRGSLYPLTLRQSGAKPVGFGAVDQRRAATELVPWKPRDTGRGETGPSLLSRLPLWTRARPLSSAYLGTDRSCTDGWLLGTAHPACHLGAIAAFPNPAQPAPVWRPGVGAQLAGYAISLTAVVVVAVALRRSRAMASRRSLVTALRRTSRR